MERDHKIKKKRRTYILSYQIGFWVVTKHISHNNFVLKHALPLNTQDRWKETIEEKEKKNTHISCQL